jgi:hypothetical protein
MADSIGALAMDAGAGDDATSSWAQAVTRTSATIRRAVDAMRRSFKGHPSVERRRLTTPGVESFGGEDQCRRAVRMTVSA